MYSKFSPQKEKFEFIEAESNFDFALVIILHKSQK